MQLQPRTDFLKNLSTLLPQMRELKDPGISMAVDDFTGASAISSFGQFPIRRVKFGQVAVKRLNSPSHLDEDPNISEHTLNRPGSQRRDALPRPLCQLFENLTGTLIEREILRKK